MQIAFYKCHTTITYLRPKKKGSMGKEIDSNSILPIPSFQPLPRMLSTHSRFHSQILTAAYVEYISKFFNLPFAMLKP